MASESGGAQTVLGKPDAGLKDRSKGSVGSGTVLGKPTEEGESPVHETDKA